MLNMPGTASPLTEEAKTFVKSVVLYKILQRYFHVTVRSRGNRIPTKGLRGYSRPDFKKVET